MKLVERIMGLFGRKRYVRVEHEDGGWFVAYPKEAKALVQFADPGDEGAFTLTDVYMTRKQFEALPEFDGF